jgi:hypothetical protein
MLTRMAPIPALPAAVAVLKGLLSIDADGDPLRQADFDTRRMTLGEHLWPDRKAAEKLYFQVIGRIERTEGGIWRMRGSVRRNIA